MYNISFTDIFKRAVYRKIWLHRILNDSRMCAKYYGKKKKHIEINTDIFDTKIVVFIGLVLVKSSRKAQNLQKCTADYFKTIL